ncbi:cupin domain-containing protein [Streptomyces sp. NPDC001604]|uniref:cupin domain-containing protein n=1 Tax=Streptomyces sp. NPDC001604 TaxID=3364593 RepID=UPI0036A69799
MSHPEHTRVIVTSTHPDGESDFQVQVHASHTEHDEAGNPVFSVTQLWGTADGTGTVGPGQNSEQVSDPWFPGPGGTRFRFFTFMPNASGGGEGETTPQLQDAQIDAGSGFVDSFDPDRPGMHISDSVDYVHVLSGEVVMELERGEITVRAGDVIIMRGGWHNWRNETDQPCTVASVMLGTHRKS